MGKVKRNIDFKEISDEDLVVMIINTKDSFLFSVLYDRYARVVYNKCFAFVMSQKISEDLTHDIFINVFLKLKSFKGNSKFSTWLYAVVYNHCINFLKKNSKKRESIVQLDSISNIENLKDDDNEVTDEEIFAISYEKLQKALLLIDYEDRVILLMKYQDDTSIKEIAVALNIGESAVKMRLLRAKKKVIEICNKL